MLDCFRFVLKVCVLAALASYCRAEAGPCFEYEFGLFDPFQTLVPLFKLCSGPACVIRLRLATAGMDSWSLLMGKTSQGLLWFSR